MRSMTRRDFLGGSAFLSSVLAGVASCGSRLPVAAEADKPTRDPSDLVYHRVPLAPDQNALGLIQEASRKLVKIEDADLQNKFEQTIEGKILCPAPEEKKRLNDLLQKNEPALALLDRAISRGQLQFPELVATDLKTTQLISWRELEHWKVLKAKMLALEGKDSEAAKELVDVIRLGQMICRGDGAFIHYLVGTAVQATAADGIRSLMKQQHLSPDILQSLLRDLNEALKAEDGIVQTYQVEFSSYSLPFLNKLPDDSDVEKTLQAAITEMFAAYKSSKAMNEKLELRKRGIAALLAGHSKPFDKAETVKLASTFFRNSIGNVQNSWKERKPDPADKVKMEVGAWPESLSLHSEDLFFIPSGKQQPEISSEALQKARKIMHGVKNPLGKHIVAWGFDARAKLEALPFRNRANLVATQTTVAIRFFYLRKRELPTSLNALVAEKLLPNVPLDPFDGKPLRYSKNRAILWSVGPDGKDNGGLKKELDADTSKSSPSKVSEPASSEREYDLVWEIPSPK